MVASQGNRGPGCATCSPSQIDVVLYPGSDRVSEYLYCTGIMSRRVGIAPPPITLCCTAGVIIVEACGHSPPPISLYCTGVILVEACGRSSPPPPIFLYCTGVILVEERGHSPPPHFLLGARVAIETVFFLCTRSVIPRNLSLF